MLLTKQMAKTIITFLRWSLQPTSHGMTCKCWSIVLALLLRRNLQRARSISKHRDRFRDQTEQGELNWDACLPIPSRSAAWTSRKRYHWCPLPLSFGYLHGGMSWRRVGWMEHLVVYLNGKAGRCAIGSMEQVRCPVTPVLVLCTDRRDPQAQRSIRMNFGWETLLRLTLAQERVAQYPHRIILHVVCTDHLPCHATL
mmetsp:Transcript_6957/g.42552  ORF Transcript_6957/g.42552 Transcript_6957/m.42552 type:complete len:198 (+) Transcript_6957:3267-3860(+)